MENFDDRVHRVAQGYRRGVISKSSRRGYSRSMGHFILYLHEKYPSLCNMEFGRNADGEASVDTICSALDRVIQSPNPADETQHPFRLADLKAEQFIYWLDGLQKRNGEKPGMATHNMHRAALKNLFRDLHQVRTLFSFSLPLASRSY